MKNEQYQEMYRLYKRGYSLSEVGKAYGMTRQSVYIGFRRRGMKLREKTPLPFQMFNGIKYSLRNTGYYGKSYGDRKMMHRAVWEYHNGDIPKGHDIHHINHNKSDNRIENLELFSKSEHAKRFSTGNNQYGKRKK